MGKLYILFLIVTITLSGCGTTESDSYDSADSKEGTYQMQTENEYFFPTEDDLHEGTWLIWPHHYTYGEEYRNEIEPIWIEMVYALHSGENIHIIAYDEVEKKYIIELLTDEGIDMSKIDFVIAKSDDVWVRDTGPIFVFDENNKLTIADFAFDGWGEKTEFYHDDAISQKVSKDRKLPIVDVSEFVLEGGSVELDGEGTLMATKSSVVSKNRNPDLTVEDAENYLRKYLGVNNFVWLDGVTDEDLTDAHIDGMARFADPNTLLTVSEIDFLELYQNIKKSDYEILRNAKNAQGEPYKLIEIPMTAKNVQGLDYKGSYLNYYIGNEVVLVPVYHDKNDEKALRMIGKLYPDREVVPIDVTSLYQHGGMIHCITQQQPFSK